MSAPDCMMRRASVADLDTIRARLKACRLHTSDLPAASIGGLHLAAHGTMIVGVAALEQARDGRSRSRMDRTELSGCSASMCN
ncbi:MULTISPECIES: hypothetical protein [Burkholderia cepacia complex]|uniref:Uncharacterized protein n=1 Tax=Burkholderia ubonensis TaxID=101571 RepID=A0A1B4LIK1_9BURK|nr:MULTISPECIES: hypothetical protein [Burkholderia cepacia complex]AOJ77036.1 hypothetical protein WJ35_18595 [Burkholderia ubonensis]AOK14134.1 hypothetical protein WK31_28055 [Burkholderia vietnamiensis]